MFIYSIENFFIKQIRTLGIQNIIGKIKTGPENEIKRLLIGSLKDFCKDS